MNLLIGDPKHNRSNTSYLVASAHALPKRPNGGTPVFQPREEILSPALSNLPDDVGINHPRAEAEDDEDDEDYPNPIDTCPADAKSQENWEHYEIGDWFRVMYDILYLLIHSHCKLTKNI